MEHHRLGSGRTPARRHLRLGLPVSLRLAEHHLASLSVTPPLLQQLPSLGLQHRLQLLFLLQLLHLVLEGLRQRLRTRHQVLLLLLLPEALILGGQCPERHLGHLHLQLSLKDFRLGLTTQRTNLLLVRQHLFLARDPQECQCRSEVRQHQDLVQWEVQHSGLHQLPSLSEQAPSPQGNVVCKHAGNTQGRSDQMTGPRPVLSTVHNCYYFSG